MSVGKGIWHWIKLAGISITTLAWAWLFYANYWNASIVAFGDVATHLADLRLLFWKYMGGGAALAAGWFIALKPALRTDTTADTVERMQARGQ
jgi:hypothetical protein